MSTGQAMHVNSIGCGRAQCGSPMEAVRPRAGYYTDVGDGIARFFCSESCAHAAPRKRRLEHLADALGDLPSSALAAACDEAPAPPPPVEGAPLLTFGEACEALVSKRGATALQYLAGGEWEDFPAQPWDDTWLSPQMVVQWSNHKFRLKPKPAPAMGRCEAIAEEEARSARDGELTRDILARSNQRVAKEVLDRVNELADKPMSWDGVMEQTRREFLGPSVPAQDQGR